MTPDHFFPGSGGILQHKLGLRNIPALDIRQQCTGFIYGLQVSDALLRAGVAKRLLLIGAEVHSPFMPFSDWETVLGLADRAPSPEERALHTLVRDRAVLFGDAGAAVVLVRDEAETERGLIDFELHSDGSNFQKLYVPSGMAHRPYVSPQILKDLGHVPHMDGKQVFRLAVTKMPEVTRSLLGRHGLQVSDVNMFIFHQATKRSSSRWAFPRTASTTISSATATRLPPPFPSLTMNAGAAVASSPAIFCASWAWAPDFIGARPSFATDHLTGRGRRTSPLIELTAARGDAYMVAL
jgi:3-oxoacyl-[acyl-carrier-protein] synthase III